MNWEDPIDCERHSFGEGTKSILPMLVSERTVRSRGGPPERRAKDLQVNFLSPWMSVREARRLILLRQSGSLAPNRSVPTTPGVLERHANSAERLTTLFGVTPPIFLVVSQVSTRHKQAR